MIQNTNYGASKTYVDAALSNTYTKAEIDTALATKANDDAVVKLTGNQTIDGDKTFARSIAIKNNENKYFTFRNSNDEIISELQVGANGLFNIYSNVAVKISNQRPYAPTNPVEDVVTLGTLNAYTPMVRISNNQVISGVKTFNQAVDITGIFNYKSKLFSANLSYGGKYNKIGIIRPGILGGVIVGMLWSSKGHSVQFRNTYGIVLIQARSGTHAYNFNWFIKGPSVQAKQFALTYDGTNIELWGYCGIDSSNENFVFTLLTEANAGTSVANIYTVAEDEIKSEEELSAYQDCLFSS